MSDNQEIIEHLKELKSSVNSLSDRVKKIEEDKEASRHEAHGQNLTQDGVDDSNLPSPCRDNIRASVDIQRDFDNLKDSLTKVPLPKSYKVNDSARGIKQEGKNTLSVISKCARYAETGLKVVGATHPLSEDETSITIEKEQFQKLFTVFTAQVNYLQAEFANLVVKNTFDEETSRLFKSFENNSAAFSDESLRNIRLAAELASHAPGNVNRGRGQQRATWRSGFGQRGSARGGYRGDHRGQWNYFPNRPPMNRNDSGQI